MAGPNTPMYLTSSFTVTDPYIAENHVVYHDVNTIEDCAIAIDATFFIQQMLEKVPSHEPLMCALAGLTGIHMHMENELNQWKAHKVTPFFVFDGQPIVGQEDVTVAAGLRDNRLTDDAWELYFKGSASEAVFAFGTKGLGEAVFPPRNLYPLLQRLLKKRKLHYIVAPLNASAQIASFDMVGSDQCAGIMGSLELLLYPIHDSVITEISWDRKFVKAVSKRQLVKGLAVSESMFIDAWLMTGTSFLPIFPPLCNASINPRQPSVVDALNMLRTGNKNITTVCSNFADVVKEPNWLDKFYKARMAVNHFIYIAESGEVKVNDYDKLTAGNYEYLGLQLPAELYHYLDKGLVGPRVLSWLTHNSINVLPTVDGFASSEYQKLVTTQLFSHYEDAVGLVAPRLDRSFQHRPITLKVWFDKTFSTTVRAGLSSTGAMRIKKWNLSTELFQKHFPKPASGTLGFELTALNNKEFVADVLKTDKTVSLESADSIVSLIWWRLLSVRGYIDDKTLEPTQWGVALAKTIKDLNQARFSYPEQTTLNTAAFLAFELIRLDLLNSKNQHAELQGFPANGSEDIKNAVVLISRVATLLQLRQDTTGYTGALSKNLLAFRTLVTTTGDATRAVVDALLANAFLSNQANRDRDDYWEIGHRLPFTEYPDASLGIAVKTYLDESHEDDTSAAKNDRKSTFPPKFVPHATHLFEDIDAAFGLFEAISVGVESLDETMLSGAQKAEWKWAKSYLVLRK